MLENAMLATNESLIRILIAALVGFVIGFSRRQKPAGVRTFTLICMGCAVFTMTSFLVYTSEPIDPTRVIGQIVTGIGFLGVGVIWRSSNGNKPTGLTTAAAIWLTASIGVLIGLGLWSQTLITTILAMTVMYSKGVLQTLKIES